jgi:hypothetical protein
VSTKVPEDAFTFYYALGVARTYDAVAEHFHVHKRTIQRAALRENWAERIDGIEKKARELTDAKLADDRHEENLRHRKMLLAMGSRAALAIQQFPLTDGMQGMKCAEIVIKLERLLSGEATERTESIEAIIKREAAQFLTTEPEDDWGDDDAPDDEHDDDQGAPAQATG